MRTKSSEKTGCSKIPRAAQVARALGSSCSRAWKRACLSPRGLRMFPYISPLISSIFKSHFALLNRICPGCLDKRIKKLRIRSQRDATPPGVSLTRDLQLPDNRKTSGPKASATSPPPPTLLILMINFPIPRPLWSLADDRWIIIATMRLLCSSPGWDPITVILNLATRILETLAILMFNFLLIALIGLAKFPKNPAGSGLARLPELFCPRPCSLGRSSGLESASSLPRACFGSSASGTRNISSLKSRRVFLYNISPRDRRSCSLIGEAADRQLANPRILRLFPLPVACRPGEDAPRLAPSRTRGGSRAKEEPAVFERTLDQKRLPVATTRLPFASSSNPFTPLHPSRPLDASILLNREYLQA